MMIDCSPNGSMTKLRLMACCPAEHTKAIPKFCYR
jgi:hypothetical protein